MTNQNNEDAMQENTEHIFVVQGSKNINELSEFKNVIRRLLEVDNIGVLLGAGVSIDAGGKVMSGFSEEIIPEMGKCFEKGKNFWERLKEACTIKRSDTTFIDIEELANYLVNVEHITSLETTDTSFRFAKEKSIEDISFKEVQESLKVFRKKIFELCSLPSNGKEQAIDIYKLFFKKILFLEYFEFGKIAGCDP